MVDVDRRTFGLNLSYLSSHRRVSSNLTFHSLSEQIISHLRNSGVQVHSGLTQSEFELVETQFGFSFPTDLRTLLSVGLPVGDGFPDWRSGSAGHLQYLIDYPFASVFSHITQNSLWPSSWGPRPSDSGRIARVTKIALKRAPILIPIFERCYIPCNPTFPGNPIFYVDENKIICIGSDLSDFFLSNKKTSRFFINGERESRKEKSSTRWIEFWSDIVIHYRRMNPVPEKDILPRRPEETPDWIRGFLEKIGTVLRRGGWEEEEVADMVYMSSCNWLDDEEIISDHFPDRLTEKEWNSDNIYGILDSDVPTQNYQKDGKVVSRSETPVHRHVLTDKTDSFFSIIL